MTSTFSVNATFDPTWLAEGATAVVPTGTEPWTMPADGGERGEGAFTGRRASGPALLSLRCPDCDGKGRGRSTKHKARWLACLTCGPRSESYIDFGSGRLVVPVNIERQVPVLNGNRDLVEMGLYPAHDAAIDAAEKDASKFAVVLVGQRLFHVVGDSAADLTDQLRFFQPSPGEWVAVVSVTGPPTLGEPT